jgi:hypothetical protein
MGTTPAAHLARLKVMFPAWSIRAIEPGAGFVAQRQDGGRLRTIYELTLDRLEDSLNTDQHHVTEVEGQ